MAAQENVDLPIDFQDPARETIVGFWWTGMLLKRASRRFFRREGSSEAQFNLLMSLKYAAGPQTPGEAPLTQNDLSRRLLVDKSNITGLIDRMEAAGLIRRNHVAGDRRSYHISLTDAGRRTVDRLDALYQQVVGEVMSAFSAEECGDLIRLTRKLRTALAETDLTR